MKLETIKSFVLVVLIGISIILSYTLWSYQPNSNQTIGGEIVGNEMDVNGSNEETKRSLIKPSDIIFHTGGAYYGFNHAKDQDRLYHQVQEWLLSNFEVNYSESTTVNRPAEGLELIFPDEIPMDILDSLFTFGPDEIHFPTWSMKRMYISFIDDSKSLRVEFLSNREEQSATALINDTVTYELLRERMNELDEESMREYLVFNEQLNPIYIPSGHIRLSTYSLTPTVIKPALFVNILFTNPAVVRETSSQTIGEVYFTDSRQMSAYLEGMRMEYVNHVVPSVGDSSHISEVDLLDRSIMSINNHSGWTKEYREEYRLEDINLNLNRVKFQMYYNGYPVFNNYKLATIQQRWGAYQNNMQLIEYDRPLYLFDSEFLLREVDDLPSGESVLDYLNSNPDISIENIQDVKIGYELKYQRDDQESEYIELTPAWYKKEYDVWQKINLTEQTTERGGN